MNQKFIAVLEQACFQVNEIQAVTRHGQLVRIYIKGNTIPWEYDVGDPSEAAAAYGELLRDLLKHTNV